VMYTCHVIVIIAGIRTMCAWMLACVRGTACVCACVRACVGGARACVCVWSARACARALCVRACVRGTAFACACLYARLCVRAHMHMGVRLCAVCVCVCVCVCARARFRLDRHAPTVGGPLTRPANKFHRARSRCLCQGLGNALARAQIRIYQSRA
jgi:hypothetical protein